MTLDLLTVIAVATGPDREGVAPKVKQKRSRSTKEKDAGVPCCRCNRQIPFAKWLREKSMYTCGKC